MPNPPPGDIPDPGTESTSLNVSCTGRQVVYSRGSPGAPVAKTPLTYCRGPSSIPGQGTSSHMPQLRVHVLQLKIPHAATKTQHSQINNCFFFFKELIATITLSLNVGITLVSARYVLSKRYGGLSSLNKG